MKPTITPIFPNLLSIPAIIPDSANDAINIGFAFVIIPSTTPTVTPDVVPTRIPFFQPSINTSKILIILLICNPNILKSPKHVAAIEIINVPPITSSSENTFLFPNLLITIIDLLNIL